MDSKDDTKETWLDIESSTIVEFQSSPTASFAPTFVRWKLLTPDGKGPTLRVELPKEEEKK